MRRCVLQTFLDFDSTESLLDAVVPVIALRPRIESMWKHVVHIGAKIPPSGAVSVYYNSVSQDAIADIQAVSSTSTKIVEKLFMASNLG